MTERQREWIQWAILFCYVYLAGYIAKNVPGPVLYWAGILIMQVFDHFNLPQRYSMNLVWVMRYIMITAEFAALGFAYCWLMGEHWRKSGLIVAIIAVILNNVAIARAYGLQVLLTASWFYADTLVACATSLIGAWLAQRNRYQPHLRTARDLLFRTVMIQH